MKLIHLKTPQQAKQWCQSQRECGHSIGFVATMGALHEGHLSLIRAASAQADCIVVSIFVNPLQFNHPADLERYPRDLETDLTMLRQAGVAMAFTGAVSDFYEGVNCLDELKLKDPGVYATGMEGKHRPGHFAGVREIVYRLFSFAGPCKAYFGEKDFQQVQIIKQLAAEMTAIEVITCPTSRAPSGLARSSRNVRLSEQGKQQAGVIYQALSAARAAWQMHERLAPTLRQAMLQVLSEHHTPWEYAEVIDPDNWTLVTPTTALTHARGLIALEIEGIRLIDNLLIGKE